LTDDSIFLLDANVFIEASRHYYAFDLNQTFWDILIKYAANGQIKSIDKVKDELEKGEDQLASWAQGQFHTAFESTDESDVFKCYAEIVTWVSNHERFYDSAKTEFADSPDGWLVAYAMAKNYVVVTHEIPAPFAKRNVKIPDVCQKFNVSYNNTFDMIRMLGEQI